MPSRIINEPIEVIAHFDDKGMHPLRFKWQDKSYRISYIVDIDDEYKNKSIRFLVRTHDDYETLCQLIFTIADLSWKFGLVQRHGPGDDFGDDFY